MLLLLLSVVIADVLVSATGDQQYMLRLSFDMTFFFIVIVILLAVFQGPHMHIV